MSGFHQSCEEREVSNGPTSSGFQAVLSSFTDSFWQRALAQE